MDCQAQIIRVILIEEQKVIREGLKILLESKSNIKVVGSFSNSDQVFSQIEDLKPNIVLISLTLSEVNGVNLVKELQQKYPQSKIIVFCNEINAADLIRYLELGVKACLLKDIPAGKIKELVHYIDRGYSHIEDKVFQKILPELSDAVSALQIADSKFQDFLNASNSEVVFNNQDESSSWVWGQNFYPQHNTTQLYLPLGYASLPENSTSFTTAEEKNTQKKWRKRIIPQLAVVGLGVAAIATGLISYFQRAEIVIEDAVINGKIVAMTSPVEGKIQEISYFEGMNLEANQMFATLELAEDKELTQTISQLEIDISLKQEQIKNGQKYLESLKNTRKILPQTSEIPINLPQSPEVATIFLDNAREIANLEQQILNQQLNINFLQKELSNLENKLKDAQADSLKNQIIPLQAPIAGAIYKLNYSEGDLIRVGQEIATFLDCQTLWVEAIVDSKVAAKINLRKDVSVQLQNQESLIAGKVNLIESLKEENTLNQSQFLTLNERVVRVAPAYATAWFYKLREPQHSPRSIEMLTSTAINNNINDNKSFSRLIINVDFATSELLLQDYCDIGLTATVSINN